jgi:hypothetical protein
VRSTPTRRRRCVEEGPATSGEMETKSHRERNAKQPIRQPGLHKRFASRLSKIDHCERLPATASGIRAANSNGVRGTSLRRKTASRTVAYWNTFRGAIRVIRSNQLAIRSTPQKLRAFAVPRKTVTLLATRTCTYWPLIVAFTSPPAAFRIPCSTGEQPLFAADCQEQGPEKHAWRKAALYAASRAKPGISRVREASGKFGTGCVTRNYPVPTRGTTNACRLDRSATTANLIEVSASVKL